MYGEDEVLVRIDDATVLVGSLPRTGGSSGQGMGRAIPAGAAEQLGPRAGLDAPRADQAPSVN
ncbi:MAG: hypothetical protein ACRD2W_21310 [Acidimicrobiales bacterium]